ncbi:hypothetical protein [Nocardia sp. XZ_19_231]|uniref:hypothetical protein n=1 Tax=Nocardia sp. XZ_19_231 TaxID=2769252 RepID=UPI00188FD108|nr:hypothetical protein [Nocardia sp. XZ_19_231]
MGEKTPWDGAAGKASIRVETGAALQAANACHDVIAVLKGCQDLLAPGKLNNYSVDAIGGTEVHAKPLRDRFIEETDQASDSVGRFIDALHDMRDMFKAAGAEYTGTDELSADEVAALKAKKDDLSKVSTSPGAVNLADIAAKAPRYTPPDYQTAGGNYTVHDDDIDVAKKPGAKTSLATAEGADVFRHHAREPSSMGWKDLQNLGRRIQWSQVSAEVPTWKVLADQVESVGTKFQTAVRTITTTNWESKGGDAALAAVQAFVGSLGSLRDGFMMTHAALQYTADFLHATAASMPVPADGETCDDVGEVQELYRKHYYVGFDEAQTMFPVAAEPAAPKGALGPPPKSTEQDPSKRDDGAGNNGAGNNGAGRNGAGTGGAGTGGTGSNSGGNQGAGGGSKQEEKAGQQSDGLIGQRVELADQQKELDKQKQQQDKGSGSQTGTGQTGAGIAGAGSTGAGSSGAGSSGAGSSGSKSGADSSSDMSSLVSAISGVISSVTQALPSVIEALSAIDLSAAMPDLTPLTQALTEFPDLRAAISDSPEFAALMAEHPELVPVAQSIGLTVDAPTPVAISAADSATSEPVTASADAAAFPRAALPDFSDLGSLADIVSPIVAASTGIAVPGLPEFAEVNTEAEGADAERRA